MSFGTEVLFMIILGLVVLGPKRLHTVLHHVVQMRTDFEKGKPRRQVSACGRT